jgi:lipid A disaccharide synthetase
VVVHGEEGKRSAINAADAAASVSGTAVLELALAGVPTVAVYRTSAVTAAIAKRLAVVPFVSLPNLMTFFRDQRIEGEREKQHRALRRAGTGTGGTTKVEGRVGDTEDTRDVGSEASGEKNDGHDGGSRRARLISCGDDGNGSYGAIPELLFDKCTVPAIADQLAQFLAHVRERRQVCDELQASSERLGGSPNVGRRSSSDIEGARLLHSDLVPWVCGRRVAHGGDAAGGEETAITGGMFGGYPTCRPLRPSDVAARVVLQEAMRAAVCREAEVSLL